MAVELAFRLAHDSTSHCTITLYRESNDGRVSLPKCRHGTTHCALLSTESPMTVELAFRHANNGTSQCQLTA